MPGVKANIIVERYFEKQLPKPYSNCDIDNVSPQPSQYASHLYDLLLNSTYEYTQQMCYDLCQSTMSLNTCGCVSMDRYGFFQSEKTCSSPNETACSSELNRKFLSHDFIIASCLHLCPLQCNRTVYRASMSSSLVFGDIFVKKIRSASSLMQDFDNRTSYVDARVASESIVRVYIFYETLAYVESTERAQSTSILTFASTIGGIRSLFLGVSVLSVFEVVEVFLAYCSP